MMKVGIRDPLTKEEAGWLTKLEKTIENSLAAFYQLGYALILIRDTRLYREKYKIFEEYCLKRWGIAKTHSYRLIEACHVVDNLQAEGDGFYNTLSPMFKIVAKSEYKISNRNISSRKWEIRRPRPPFCFFDKIKPNCKSVLQIGAI